MNVFFLNFTEPTKKGFPLEINIGNNEQAQILCDSVFKQQKQAAENDGNKLKKNSEQLEKQGLVSHKLDDAIRENQTVIFLYW